jgi:hypothetical protein
MKREFSGSAMGSQVFHLSEGWATGQVPSMQEMAHLEIKDENLKEKDFDILLMHRPDVLGTLLAERGLINDPYDLIALGSEVRLSTRTGTPLRIDVLMGEYTGNRLVRLVIVENKLLSNPQARREVVAQGYEYSLALSTDIEAATLREAIHKSRESWTGSALDASATAIVQGISEVDLQSVIDSGSVLLVIAGDDIHRDAERLARAFDRQVNPTSDIELALVSLRLYKGASGLVLVPNLIGTVLRAERSLTVTVRVASCDGQPVRSQATAEFEATLSQGPAASSSETPEEAKLAWEQQYGEASWANIQRFVDWAAQHGFQLSHTGKGFPVVTFDAGRLGIAALAHTQFPQEGIADSLQSLTREDPSGPVANVIATYRDVLVKAGGAVSASGRVHIHSQKLAASMDAICSGALALREGIQRVGSADRRPPQS